MADFIFKMSLRDRMEHPAECKHSRHLHGAHGQDGSLACSGRDEVSARAGARAQGCAGVTARDPQALLPAPRASALPSLQEHSLASSPLQLKSAPAVTSYRRTAHRNLLKPSLESGAHRLCTAGPLGPPHLPLDFPLPPEHGNPPAPRNSAIVNPGPAKLFPQSPQA